MPETLPQRTARLRIAIARATALADFWDGKVLEHGETKALSLYCAVSERRHGCKTYDFEGLTLSRKPTELEALFVKDIAAQQDNGKDDIAKLLKDVTKKLNKQGLDEVESLEPAEYHTLTLDVPKGAKKELRDLLDDIYGRGRSLVAEELSKQKGNGPAKDWTPMEVVAFGSTAMAVGRRISYVDNSIGSNGHATKKLDPTDEELEELADLTLSRVVNSIQARIVDAISALRALGFTGDELMERLRKIVEDLSESPQERAAAEAANRAIGMGRADEAQAQESAWVKVIYSALTDSNVCSVCAEADGMEASDESELPDAPNPDCEGGGQCRCFHVFVSREEI